MNLKGNLKVEFFTSSVPTSLKNGINEWLQVSSVEIVQIIHKTVKELNGQISHNCFIYYYKK